MCGIAGTYLYHRKAGESDEAAVNAAIQSIAHRGPDHRAVIRQNQACFGHARLSIIDTSDSGNQPMWESTERFVITYNGELYNYKALREVLIQKGLVFRTNCDTEVVLNAYAHFGSDCVQHMNGFFAFAVYDRKEDRFFAARDRMGIKPFYYALGDDRISFGSELSAVMAMTKNPVLNRKALRLYFQLTYIPAPHSIIEGIHKLKPGHFIEVSGGNFRTQRYFDLKETTPSSTPFKDAAQQIRSELERSVQMRLMSDVPLGTFLSGGIDSSIVSSIAARHHPNLETFSLGFRDSRYLDESETAARVAQHIKSKHHKFMVGREDLAEHLDPMLSRLDEPFADSSSLAVYILSKYTAEHVKVVLSGDGADELFGGYRKHMALLKSEQDSLTNRLFKTVGPMLPKPTGARGDKLGDVLRKVEKYSAGLQLKFSERYWKWLEWTSSDVVDELLIDPASDNAFKDGLLSQLDSSNLNNMLLADQEILLPGDMLNKVDRMSMVHGLEVRTPFLDHNLVKIVNDLPQHFKLSESKGKLLLREAFAQQIPDFVFQRGKKGFEIPVEHLLRNELSGQLIASSNKQLIEEQSVFKYDALKHIISEFMEKGQSHWAPTLWSFVVFQNWWKRNMGHQS